MNTYFFFKLFYEQIAKSINHTYFKDHFKFLFANAARMDSPEFWEDLSNYYKGLLQFNVAIRPSLSFPEDEGVRTYYYELTDETDFKKLYKEQIA